MVGNKRIISLVLSATMLIGSVGFAYASDIDSMEDKQYELELQNSQYESIIEETKNDIARQQEYMDAIMNKIENINEQIYISNKKISDINDQINELQVQISEAKKQIEDTLDLLRERIKAIYLAGEASSLELILGAADFTDFMDKVDLVQSISDFDSRLIKELEGKMTKINAQRKEIEKMRSEADAELEKQKQKKAELQQLQDENQAAMDKLNEQLEEHETLVEENNSALAQINQEIEDYYEEQRRLAEEQERNNQQNNSPDNDNNNIGSNITSDGSYVWPTPGFYYLTSEWNEDRGSYNHGAIDIAGSGIWGTPVIAAQSGTVTFVSNYCTHDYGKYWSCGCGGGYGNYVMIDHGNGYSTLYGHLSNAIVSQGEYVSQGQTIGYVGSTGESTGPHLHFETRLWGVKYNPMSEY
ncbi:MAG: murein hydrolase activator EnvC family protein [Acutalibacteraceae bacterium]